jgi:hypothetical protein
MDHFLRFSLFKMILIIREALTVLYNKLISFMKLDNSLSFAPNYITLDALFYKLRTSINNLLSLNQNTDTYHLSDLYTFQERINKRYSCNSLVFMKVIIIN